MGSLYELRAPKSVIPTGSPRSVVTTTDENVQSRTNVRVARVKSTRPRFPESSSSVCDDSGASPRQLTVAASSTSGVRHAAEAHTSPCARNDGNRPIRSPYDPDDNLRTARGVIFGIGIGLAMYGIGALIVLALWR